MKVFDKKVMCGALAGAMLLSFTACSMPGKKDKKVKVEDDPKAEAAFDYDEVRDADYDETSYSSDYNKYAFDIMSTTAGYEDKDKNIMISPASIMFAMDLAAAGANGDTLDQITNAFSEGGDAVEQQAFAASMMDKINDSEGVEFSCANAIWNNSTILGDKVSSNFVDYVEDTFNAEITVEEFSNDTVGEINGWVEDNTNGMIDKIIDQLEPETAMVLVNAIAFEGEWADAYEDYQVEDGEFTASSGSSETVTFLNGMESVYFESDKATGFMKYYEGGEYAFVAILPSDESISANEFIGSFSGEDYIEFISGAKYGCEVSTKIPEFTSEYEITMNDVLKDLGIEDAFDENSADFTGITTETKLSISKVLHKTFIEVDRNGTKAAAVTAVMVDGAMACEPEPVEYYEVFCDRSFAYAIVDVETMNPIFVGTVNSVG